MTRRIVFVGMKLSQEMIGRERIIILTVVDQTRVLWLRTGQHHVLQVRNVMENICTLPFRVVTYGYHYTRNVTVEQYSLQKMIIILVSNSVVPPPPPASAPGHQMEMDTVKDQSILDRWVVVKLVYVTVDLGLPVDQKINVFGSLICAMVENLCVKMGLM